jgi:GNAT superfamily N-acetyltransferase
MEGQRKLVPTRRDTYRQASQVLGRAFMDETVSQYVYRGLSPEKRLKNLTADFTGELWVGVRRGQPVHILQDDKIVAAALIYPPGAYPLNRLDELVVSFWMIWGHSPYDLRSWLIWLKEAGKHHPTQSHYYLEYIGVDPAFQGKGLGSMILDHVITQADQAQVGCYLETVTRINLPLYQRFGFQIICEETIIGLPTWFMWRPSINGN